MSPERRLTVSDPERIRAMAHPTRLELLDVLHELGEATATECAERIGESVASCSFHLRTLAKYGYIERAKPRGREKPWRMVARTVRTEPAPDVPGSLHAATELARLSFGRASAALAESLDRLADEPPEWVQAANLTTSTAWLTATEAAELANQLAALMEPFTGRQHDPSRRPEGARRIHLLAAVYSDPPTEGS